MITKLQNVLILGAGASAPFGLPTADILVEKVRDRLSDPKYSEFDTICAACLVDSSLISEFQRRLKGADVTIDEWLGKEENAEFEKIGKAAIALCLLNHESKNHLRPTGKLNWYQLLWRRLQRGATFKTIQKNKLSIVTFNYDRSLEYDLFQRLSNLYPGKTEQEYANKLNATIPIVHVYGSLGPLLWQDPYKHKVVRYDINDYWASLRNVEGATVGRDFIRQAVEVAMANIKIPREDSETPDMSKNFTKARDLIQKAQALYFLGFGYHPINMDKLGIDSLRLPTKIMGTGQGLEKEQKDYIHDLYLRSFSEEHRSLVNKNVYDFLRDNVNFNKLG